MPHPWTKLDEIMRRYSPRLRDDLGLTPPASNYLASAIASEVQALPRDVLRAIRAEDVVGLHRRIDELVAFEGFMDFASQVQAASGNLPSLTRAQVTCQLYTVFVYLGEACFAKLRESAASGSVLKKCCKYLTDYPIQVFATPWPIPVGVTQMILPGSCFTIRGRAEDETEQNIRSHSGVGFLGQACKSDGLCGIPDNQRGGLTTGSRRRRVASLVLSWPSGPVPLIRIVNVTNQLHIYETKSTVLDGSHVPWSAVPKVRRPAWKMSSRTSSGVASKALSRSCRCSTRILRAASPSRLIQAAKAPRWSASCGARMKRRLRAATTTHSRTQFSQGLHATGCC